jgi:hypothetical protein
MMLASASAIQIWTLAVAGLAVGTSLAGIFINAFLVRRSEHKTWQRDLRIRIYTDCVAFGDKFLLLMFDLARARADPNADQGVAAQTEVDIRRQVFDLVRELSAVSAATQTFASDSVGVAALGWVWAIKDAVDHSVPGTTLEEGEIHNAIAGTALTNLRVAIRRSMNISDD